MDSVILTKISNIAPNLTIKQLVEIIRILNTSYPNYYIPTKSLIDDIPTSNKISITGRGDIEYLTTSSIN